MKISPVAGGRCPCCAKRFKAAPPTGLEPGSPFGPNLRAFAIYLRASHAVSFERLARLISDLIGLEISEGALVNSLAGARETFAWQTSLIRERLLSGAVVQSDETGMRGSQDWLERNTNTSIAVLARAKRLSLDPKTPTAVGLNT